LGLAEPWFTHQAYQLDTWHCALNPRVCRDCLFSRIFAGVFELGFGGIINARA
jgi:hypothetical protein